MTNRWYGLILSTTFLAALVSQVYVPDPHWHVYFVECSLLAAWLVADGIYRRASFVSVMSNAAFALVMAPLAVPHWYASRPLLPGEWRKGGNDTNFLLSFGIVTLLFTGISAASNLLAFGPDRGFELIINSGFAVAGTAIVLSLVARNDRVLEKGPKIVAGKQSEKLE